MNIQVRTRSSAIVAVAGFVALVLVTVATLAGWSHFGTDILLNAASSGLSWCF